MDIGFAVCIINIFTLFVDRMNIIGGKITISKAKRHLGSEITAAEENTSHVSSPKTAVIPASCHPSEGQDQVQTTVTMETPGKPESCRLDSDPCEDAVASKVIEKLMSEMLDQCVDEADLTDVASVFSVVVPVDDSEEKLNDERTVDQGRVAPCSGDGPGVPGTLAEVASTEGNIEGNRTETKELTDLDSECDMFEDSPDFEEVHRDNTDGHIFLHSSDASAEDCARVPSPGNSIRNSKASGCAEQMPNAVPSNVTGLVLQEQSQISYAEIEGSVNVMQCTAAPPGVVVESGKVSVVFNSSIPCEEATAVLNDDINGSIVNGEDDDILPNDKSFSSNEECNTVSKCKSVPMPNSESTMMDKDLVLPSEDITFSGGECVGSWEDGETLDGAEDDVNLLVEFDAELGIISIDSRANSRKNEPEVSVSSLCESHEIATAEEVTGESSEASIDVPQAAPHCHLYFL